MFKKTILLTIAALALSATAQAAPYGMAGCGLGSLVFQDQKGPVQIVAATLNHTGFQTFGMTTGTSNCNDETSKAITDRYIETNKVALKGDIARGNGETLAGLLTIWKCDNSSKVGPALQKNYGQIFSSEATTEQIKSSIQNTIQGNKELSTACLALI